MSLFKQKLHINVLCGRCFICLRPPLPYVPILPPPHTLYTCIQVYLFTTTIYLLIHKGKGGEGKGEELPERRLERAIVHNAGRKYQHDCLPLQSIITTNVPVVFTARYVGNDFEAGNIHYEGHYKG
jgi:hypothetical protein